MSIYIEDMEIPKDGSCIQIVIDDDGKIYPSVEKCILKIDSIAKAVSAPPHEVRKSRAVLRDAPIIIPSNLSKEEQT